VNQLAAQGHDITVIAPAGERPDGELPYHFIPVPAPLFRKNQARWVTLSISFAQALRRLEAKTHIDLVHFTDAREAMWSSSRIPRIGNINDTYSAALDTAAGYRQHYRDWLIRWAYYHFVHQCEAWTLPHLDAVIANSHFTSQVIQSEYHLHPHKLHTCYKSVDASFFTPVLEQRIRTLSHPPRVLCIGGNLQRKGIPDLIEASQSVLADLPNTEFWIAGQDPATPEMIRLCKRLGVADHFFFLGSKTQQELLDLYTQVDVFAMPSLTEAFGVVFLEAMAAGIPVVGTTVGGIPEIIQDRRNGRLVPPGHPGALAQVLLDILKDPNLQACYRQAGLATVQEFSVARMMGCTYEVYRQVLGSRFP
jgi:glycosyltransferase involved in cell wall biosynthesis